MKPNDREPDIFEKRNKMNSIAKQALLEDAVDQDVTSLNLINKEQILSGSFIVCGTCYAKADKVYEEKMGKFGNMGGLGGML